MFVLKGQINERMNEDWMNESITEGNGRVSAYISIISHKYFGGCMSESAAFVCVCVLHVGIPIPCISIRNYLYIFPSAWSNSSLRLYLNSWIRHILLNHLFSMQLSIMITISLLSLLGNHIHETLSKTTARGPAWVSWPHRTSRLPRLSERLAYFWPERLRDVAPAPAAGLIQHQTACSHINIINQSMQSK